jgi:hypothetical protein
MLALSTHSRSEVMSRLDRVKNPEARLLLGRASRRQRVGDADGALRSAAAALACLVATYPEAATALSAKRMPEALQVYAENDKPPSSVASDAPAAVEFVLQLALGLGL